MVVAENEVEVEVEAVNGYLGVVMERKEGVSSFFQRSGSADDLQQRSRWWWSCKIRVGGEGVEEEGEKEGERDGVEKEEERGGNN